MSLLLGKLIKFSPLNDVVSSRIVVVTWQAELDTEILGLTSIIDRGGGGICRWADEMINNGHTDTLPSLATALYLIALMIA